MDHISDLHLRRRLGALATAAACSFCTGPGGSPPGAVDLRLLLASVMAGVREKYEETAEPDRGLPTGLAVEDVCRRAVDPKVARALLERVRPARWRLREVPGPGDPAGAAPVEPWSVFRERVRRERRPVPPWSGADRPGGASSTGVLDAVSAAVQRLGLVRTLPPGHRVWRGRMRADTARPGYSAASIGSTPPSRATANRMSPAGVPMFYGSEDVATVVAEISAHDPRPYVAAAAFRTTRPVPVVDLSNVPDEPSVFDPGRESLIRPVAFIRAFSEDLSQPVVLDGRERTAYVPTQVLTEYFRRLSPLRVQGIVFRSAQNGGINYVLFTGPEGCVDAHTAGPSAMLRLQPHTEIVVGRAPGAPGGGRAADSVGAHTARPV
ncbi:RES family NAD+ phosphorylase [Streptomyces sp. NPDC020141]|uniref:RES family NAD+ phosphorylase n=1 Tax=Streptomyces sp. NPDC020141 TaxID=3365065 RepID=UPI0037A390AE